MTKMILFTFFPIVLIVLCLEVGSLHILWRRNEALLKTKSSYRLYGKSVSDLEGPFITHPSIAQILHPNKPVTSNNITYENDLLVFKGIENYKVMQTTWQQNLPRRLNNATFHVYRVSKLSSSNLIMYWNATFLPESISGLVSLGHQVPGWRVNYFNVLDKEQSPSSFSWKALGLFFQRVLTTGEMRLPIAVILGSTEFFFDEAPEGGVVVLTGQKESMQLARNINSGYTKNRKLALDLLEFLDALRPGSVDINDYADLVTQRIRYRNIQGLKQFDVDGLSSAEQSQALELSSRVLSWFTGLVLVVGVGLGWVVVDKALHYRQEEEYRYEKKGGFIKILQGKQGFDNYDHGGEELYSDE